MSEADYILLVEDDATIAEVVTAYLAEAGYLVNHHEWGRETLEHARKELMRGKLWSENSSR